jgi:hypothetical protein
MTKYSVYKKTSEKIKFSKINLLNFIFFKKIKYECFMNIL